MVCKGTKLMVIRELEKLSIKYESFEKNEIDFENDLSLTEINLVDQSLHEYGLELVFKKSNLVSKIQYAILDLVENKITLKTSFSYYISLRIGKNYTYLSKFFRKFIGIPMEEYYSEKINEKMRLNQAKWAEVLNSSFT